MPNRVLSAMLLRVVLGTLWAAVLFLTGLWCVTWVAGVLSAYRVPVTLGGIGLMLAATYIFGDIVASRVFPQADRTITGSVLLIAGITFPLMLLGAALTAWGR
jgi:hypothetical protein